MNWKHVVLVVALIFALVIGLNSVQPGFVQVTEFTESANIKLGDSAFIPFSRDFEISGLALSGYWEGPGYAQVFLSDGETRLLVFDTRNLLGTIEFESFGSRFNAACMETCSFSPLKPKELVALVHGPGFLTIDSYHYSVPLSPSGLASCPNCKKVRQPVLPNHSLLVLIILLLGSVFGSHTLSHVCGSPHTKRLLLIVFLVGFLSLAGIFGSSVAAPTSAFAVGTKHAASIVAAFGVIILFVIAGIEMIVRKKEVPSDPDTRIWSELEEAEEKWEK